MNKSEAKFNNTAIKMHQALFELLEIKDFRDISISEICRKARVNRSTFYAHYENLSDLLEETEERLMSHFFNRFYAKQTTNGLSLSKENHLFATTEYIRPYLEYVKENRKLFTTYLKHAKEFRVDKIYRHLLKEVFAPALKERGIDNEILMSYLAKYYLSGIHAITMNWVERDCIDEINTVCDIILMCVKAD